MTEWFEHVKIVGDITPGVLADTWKENFELLKEEHKIVAKKVKKNILKYTQEQDFDKALLKLAKELIDRHNKHKQLQSVKIALTYSQYLYYHYGSLVKFYIDGTIAYASRSTIEGYGFIIYDEEEV